MTMKEKEYVPFGEEWVKHMMTWRKIDLVNLLRRKLIEIKDLTNESDDNNETL